MANFTTETFLKDDDYFTPKSAWEDIKDYIPNNKIIWEAFFNKNSKSADYLKELGFKVLSEDIDFFNNDKGDIIVSNPPFTMRKEIMKRLQELDKPFILIMSCSTLATQYLQKTFKNKLQIIVPKKRIQFVDKNLKQTKRANFDCFYFCYKINLRSDLIML